MKKVMMILLVAGMILGLSACSKKNETKTTLIVGTSPDYAPYEFIDPDTEEVVGADVELMKYIAEQMGLELKIETAEFGTLIQGLKDGKYDISISGFTYKEDRLEQVDYSDAYSSEGYQGVLIKKDMLSVYTSPSAFDGKSIQAQSGSTQEALAQEQISGATYTPFAQISDGVLNLKSGKADGIVIASESGEQIMETNDDLAMAPFELEADEKATSTYVLVQKGDTEMLEKINAIIKKVVDEGLYKQWTEAAKQLASEKGVN